MKQLFKNISPFNNELEMSNGLFIIKKMLAFWVCYIAGLFLAEGIVILLHFVLGKNIFEGEMFDSLTITLITYYGYIVVAIVALLYWKIIERKPLSKMGVTIQFGNYFIGIIIAVLVLILCVSLIIWTGNMEYYGFLEDSNMLILALFVGGFIIQGATEEILCRGIVLHSLKEKTSLTIAISVSTFLFIVPHFSSLFSGAIIYGVIGIINLVFISVILSLLTIHFNSIWVACGLHSCWNLIVYSVLGLNLSGTEDTVVAIVNMDSIGNNVWNGGQYGIEASIITTFVLAITALLIFYITRKGVSSK